MTKDYYKILGVSKDATKEDIKKAYKKLAKKHHPDINGDSGSTEKFKEINEAASILGDDQKRQHYDQFGTAESAFGAGGAGADFNNFGFDFGGGGFDFGDIFDQLFGGGRRSRGRAEPRAGNDLLYEMEIELEDAYFGAKKSIVIPRLEKCSNCDGTGANSKYDIVTCPDCHGSGHLKQERRTPFGYFQTTGPCAKCKGTGEYIKNECNTCDGTTLVKKTRKVEVHVPKGVEDGMRLRIQGQGEAGPKGAPQGNLYVQIHIKPHKTFERDSGDLYVDVPISFSNAALGSEIEVPTMEGKAKLKIPPGTQTNTLFRMRGKGIPSINDTSVGNQNVRVIVRTPEKLNKKQKELLKEFDQHGKHESFLKKVFA